MNSLPAPREHTHTHTHSGRAFHKYYTTNFYSYTCTRGHFWPLSALLWGSKRQSEKETTGLPQLNLVSLFMCSSDDDSRFTMKSRSTGLILFRLRLVSIMEAHILFYKGLQVCECVLVSTRTPPLALTLTVTCSTPPLSPEPTHWTLSLSHTHLLTSIQFLTILVFSISYHW